MESPTIVYFAIFCAINLLVFVSGCEPEEYRDLATNTCVPCTEECPEEFFELSPCEQNKNRVCFPLNIFKQAQEDSTKKQTGTTFMEYKTDTDQWKKMAFWLIGVLCLLVVSAAVIVFVSCRQYCQMRSAKALVSHAPTDIPPSELDGEYVVIHRRPYVPVPTEQEQVDEELANLGMSPALQNHHSDVRENCRWSRRGIRQNRYRPQRRLLSECVDDVFESEDSASSKSASRGPLHTILESPDKEMEDKSQDEENEQTHFLLKGDNL